MVKIFSVNGRFHSQGFIGYIYATLNLCQSFWPRLISISGKRDEQNRGLEHESERHIPYAGTAWTWTQLYRNVY